MPIVRWVLRQVLGYLCSQLPFKLVMKMVKVLLESQGFGSGARVATSGEIEAAHYKQRNSRKVSGTLRTH